MASLTTVYMISILFTSIAGVSAAFLGNRIFPLVGGAQEQPMSLQQIPTEVPVSQNIPSQSL